MTDLELYNGTVLYHGSYCPIEFPNLEMCADRKDFGKGFYLTTSREQAVGFLNTSIIKASNKGVISKNQSYGYVSKYTFNIVENLYEFTHLTVNQLWLHCIIGHRDVKYFQDVVEELKMYDIITGKVADDATNTTIMAYIMGVFGEIGTIEADTICIQKLLPERLQNQFCFRTQRSLNCLTYEGSERICLGNLHKHS